MNYVSDEIIETGKSHHNKTVTAKNITVLMALTNDLQIETVSVEITLQI